MILAKEIEPGWKGILRAVVSGWEIRTFVTSGLAHGRLDEAQRLALVAVEQVSGEDQRAELDPDVNGRDPRYFVVWKVSDGDVVELVQEDRHVGPVGGRVGDAQAVQESMARTKKVCRKLDGLAHASGAEAVR